MTGSFVAAYIHLVLTVFLVGYVLYWAVMVVALRRSCDPGETLRLLGVASRARWPHVVVPWAMRVPLPLTGWAFLLILLASGVALASEYGWSPLLLAKLALVAAFAVIQLLLTRRPVPVLIFANFALALVIVVLSGWLARV
jgi:hypothetical protein